MRGRVKPICRTTASQVRVCTATGAANTSSQIDVLVVCRIGRVVGAMAVDKWKFCHNLLGDQIILKQKGTVEYGGIAKVAEGRVHDVTTIPSNGRIVEEQDLIRFCPDVVDGKDINVTGTFVVAAGLGAAEPHLFATGNVIHCQGRVAGRYRGDKVARVNRIGTDITTCTRGPDILVSIAGHIKGANANIGDLQDGASIGRIDGDIVARKSPHARTDGFTLVIPNVSGRKIGCRRREKLRRSREEKMRPTTSVLRSKLLYLVVFLVLTSRKPRSGKNLGHNGEIPHGPRRCRRFEKM